MKKFSFVTIAVVSSTFLGACWVLTLEALFGVPWRIEVTGIWGWWYNPDFYEGVWWLAPMFASFSAFVAWHSARKGDWRLPVGLGCVGVLAGCGAHFSNPPHLLCFVALPPDLPFPAVLILYASIVGVFYGVGRLIGRWWQRDLSHEPAPLKPTSPSPRGPYDLGFSLVELLAVVAIVLIIAAFLLPVFQRSKRTAVGTSDWERMHQVYTAEVLYENDHDNQSPPSLAELTPRYAPASVMVADLDPRNKNSPGGWPVNHFMGFDTDGSRAKAYVNYPISFTYLRSFEARFHPGDTWQTYRDDPNVGMMADTTLQYAPTPRYDDRLGPHQMPSNFSKFFVCRMDGSLALRQSECEVPTSYEDLFLFWKLTCTAGGSGPG